MRSKGSDHKKDECLKALSAIRDTVYVLGGKWKHPILMSLVSGPKRFKELSRELEGITPKVLSKELKELEINGFISRTVYDTSPVTVEYDLTDYGDSLDGILRAMRDWGIQH